MYGGLDAITSKGPNGTSGSSVSPGNSATRSATLCRAAFMAAAASASAEMSVANTCAPGACTATATAIAPGPRAHVGNARIGVPINVTEHGLDQKLGFGPRNKHGGRDVKGHAVKLALAGKVCQRLAPFAPGDERIKARRLVGADVPLRAQAQLFAGDAQRVSEQQSRLGPGLVGLDAGCREPSSGGQQQVRYGAGAIGGECHGASAASACCFPVQRVRRRRRQSRADG
jgi:hypothetical protein